MQNREFKFEDRDGEQHLTEYKSEGMFTSAHDHGKTTNSLGVTSAGRTFGESFKIEQKSVFSSDLKISGDKGTSGTLEKSNTSGKWELHDEPSTSIWDGPEQATGMIVEGALVGIVEAIEGFFQNAEAEREQKLAERKKLIEKISQMDKKKPEIERKIESIKAARKLGNGTASASDTIRVLELETEILRINRAIRIAMEKGEDTISLHVQVITRTTELQGIYEKKAKADINSLEAQELVISEEQFELARQNKLDLQNIIGSKSYQRFMDMKKGQLLELEQQKQNFRNRISEIESVIWRAHREISWMQLQAEMQEVTYSPEITRMLEEARRSIKELGFAGEMHPLTLDKPAVSDEDEIRKMLRDTKDSLRIADFELPELHHNLVEIGIRQKEIAAHYGLALSAVLGYGSYHKIEDDVKTNKEFQVMARIAKGNGMPWEHLGYSWPSPVFLNGIITYLVCKKYVKLDSHEKVMQIMHAMKIKKCGSKEAAEIVENELLSRIKYMAKAFAILVTIIEIAVGASFALNSIFGKPNKEPVPVSNCQLEDASGRTVKKENFAEIKPIVPRQTFASQLPKSSHPAIGLSRNETWKNFPVQRPHANVVNLSMGRNKSFARTRC